MSKRAKGDYFQDRLFALIKEKTKELNKDKTRSLDNKVAMSQAVLAFCEGDPGTALFLSQLAYWCDRGKREDGFVYISFREWEEQIGLSQYQVKHAAAWLGKKKLVEVRKGIKFDGHGGHQTLFYRLDTGLLEQGIVKFLTKHYQNFHGHCEKFKGALLKISQSYTDTSTDPSTETSSETTKRDKGREFQKPNSRPLSLNAFLAEAKKRGEPVHLEAVEAIRYFLDRYHHYRGEKHPRLRYEQWCYHVDTILSCDDEMGRSIDYTSTDLKVMICKYFETQFENCDYRLHHFNTDGVKERRFFEECY